MLVLLLDDGLMVADAVSGGHGEVAQRGEHDDQGRDDVVQALGDWHIPCHAGEDHAGNQHDDEDNPGRSLACCVQGEWCLS